MTTDQTATDHFDFMDENVPPLDNPFSHIQYDLRKRALIAEMERRKLGFVLLSSPESQCWLHGYQARWYRTGSPTVWPPLNFTAVTAAGDMLLFDSEDHEKLMRHTSILPEKDWRYITDPRLDKVHAFVIHEVRRLYQPPTFFDGWGIEKWSPRQNYATTTDLVSHLKSYGRVEDVSVTMRKLQRLKSEAELNVMRKAGRLLDAAYEKVTPMLHPDMTEIQVWAELEKAMAYYQDLSGEADQVRGGETAALHNTIARTRHYYHALSTSRKIGYGQLHADPSAVLHRYHVNTARQFYLLKPGEARPSNLVHASEVAAGALEVIEQRAETGMKFAELASHLRKHYEDHGLWGRKDWIGGYQLGISFTPDWVGEFVWNVDKHEDTTDYVDTYDPEDHATKEQKIIRSNLVTNFESYVDGAGFIDTIVFKDKGIEVLSRTPRTVQFI